MVFTEEDGEGGSISTGQDALFHTQVRKCLVWGFGWGSVVVIVVLNVYGLNAQLDSLKPRQDQGHPVAIARQAE